MPGPGRRVEVLVLGSGGAVPRARRQPSILLRDWMGNYILLDAGEGVQMWLMNAGVSPSRIDVVAVTHPHGDHVNGLAGLLMTMSLEGRRRPLTIVSTRETLEFVMETLEATEARLGFKVDTVEARGRSYAQLKASGGDKVVLSWYPTCHTIESVGFRIDWILRPRIDPGRLSALGLKPGPWLSQLVTRGEALVEGRRVRLGDIASTPPASLSIAYTGDTMHPCPGLEEAVSGVDILIHEATLGEAYLEEARSRGHSTPLQAARLALKSGVGLLVLYHVSGRYEGFEARRLLSEARRVFPNTVLAWDGMRLVVSPFVNERGSG